jgi:ribosomal protein L11 methylase PrmA
MVATELLPHGHPVAATLDPQAAHILTHPRLPFITYPYEWPFHALKAAALAHLDLHMHLLDEGFTLSDASAFNMQFDGPHPLHIDALSVIPYSEGERWMSYNQFLRQFLNPLVFEAQTGMSFAHCFRATLDGPDTAELFRLLPWHCFLRPGYALHIAAPALAERHSRRLVRHGDSSSLAPLPKSRFTGLLRHLHGLISSLKPRHSNTTRWCGYTSTTSYDDTAAAAKRQLVASFVQARRPSLLLDIGCNSGDFSLAAIESGAARVIGMDSDRGAADAAFRKSAARKLPFTVLVADLANPSPAQGWRGMERGGMFGRIHADAVLALAVTHHLAIGENIPLPEVMATIASLAPCGLVEFVPLSDPQIQEMLRFRTTPFPDYTLEAARAGLSRHARITREDSISGSERVLLQFEQAA